MADHLMTEEISCAYVMPMIDLLREKYPIVHKRLPEIIESINREHGIFYIKDKLPGKVYEEEPVSLQHLLFVKNKVSNAFVSKLELAVEDETGDKDLGEEDGRRVTEHQTVMAGVVMEGLTLLFGMRAFYNIVPKMIELFSKNKKDISAEKMDPDDLKKLPYDFRFPVTANTSYGKIHFNHKPHVTVTNYAYRKMKGMFEAHMKVAGFSLVDIYQEQITDDRKEFNLHIMFSNAGFFRRLVNTLYNRGLRKQDIEDTCQKILFTHEKDQANAREVLRLVEKQRQDALSLALMEREKTNMLHSLERQVHDLTEANWKLVPYKDLSQSFGGKVHDGNNSLAGTLGYLELIRINYYDQIPEMPMKLIEKAFSAALDLSAKLRSIIDDCKKPQRAEKGYYSLGSILEEVIQEVSKNYPGVCVQKSIKHDLPDIYIHYDLFKEAVKVVVNNAFQALPQSKPYGLVTVDLSGRNGKLLVDVSDNGSGIDMGIIESGRLFDQDYTTKKLGTGFGLSFFKNVMDGLGATYDVLSKPGEGTMFRIEVDPHKLRRESYEMQTVRNP